MDTTVPKTEISREELARESLIAISQATPERFPSPNFLPVKPPDGNGSVLCDRVGSEDFRSKLISISYTQSPDVQPLPPTVENPGV